MEEISRMIEEHKAALKRVLKFKFNQEEANICIGHKRRLKTPLIVLLWVVTGISAIVVLNGLFNPTDNITITVISVFAVLAFINLILIRVISYEINCNLEEAKFVFKGQLRRKRTYTLAEYEGAETRRTIKDFPEEFWVKFKTAKGTKSYKLADLNKGFSRNIEPNYEAITAFWDAIIKQMQLKDNYQPEG